MRKKQFSPQLKAQLTAKYRQHQATTHNQQNNNNNTQPQYTQQYHHLSSQSDTSRQVQASTHNVNIYSASTAMLTLNHKKTAKQQKEDAKLALQFLLYRFQHFQQQQQYKQQRSTQRNVHMRAARHYHHQQQRRKPYTQQSAMAFTSPPTSLKYQSSFCQQPLVKGSSLPSSSSSSTPPTTTTTTRDLHTNSSGSHPVSSTLTTTPRLTPRQIKKLVAYVHKTVHITTRRTFLTTTKPTPHHKPRTTRHTTQPTPRRAPTPIPTNDVKDLSKQLFYQQQRFLRWQFKRYWGPARGRVFKGWVDIFSPLRTIYNYVRPMRWKLRRFLPGRMLSYLLSAFQWYVYLWIFLWMFERDRQFDTGWVSPENTNFGYFFRTDWSRAAAAHDVEIFKRRKSFKKKDGTRFRHEEDLRMDRTKYHNWQWTAPNRYAQPRGAWPIRKYVINSPMYADRKYLGTSYMDTEEVQGRLAKRFKWNHASDEDEWGGNAAKRALRIRGTTKYEYGGTAHHYYYTKLHDKDRFMTVRSGHAPSYNRAMVDAAKY